MMGGGYMRMTQSEVIRCDEWWLYGETGVGASAHCCGWSKRGTDGPPRTPHGNADCPLGAPMGGNQQKHGWALFDIHVNVPKCICILAGLLLPALLMATTETV